jgi:hypothetical protein
VSIVTPHWRPAARRKPNTKREVGCRGLYNRIRRIVVEKGDIAAQGKPIFGYFTDFPGTGKFESWRHAEQVIVNPLRVQSRAGLRIDQRLPRRVSATFRNDPEVFAFTSEQGVQSNA